MTHKELLIKVCNLVVLQKRVNPSVSKYKTLDKKLENYVLNCKTFNVLKDVELNENTLVSFIVSLLEFKGAKND